MENNMQPNDELNGLIKKAKRQKCIIVILFGILVLTALLLAAVVYDNYDI